MTMLGEFAARAGASDRVILSTVSTPLGNVEVRIGELDGSEGVVGTELVTLTQGEAVRLIARLANALAEATPQPTLDLSGGPPSEV